MQNVAIFDEEVNLMTALVPPKENRRLDSVMEISLDYLSNYVIFEQSPPQRVCKELVLIAYAQHKAGETGVMKIKLWTFDDPFIEISKVRREQENDKARL
jgi:hypothetical protein